MWLVGPRPVHPVRDGAFEQHHFDASRSRGADRPLAGDAPGALDLQLRRSSWMCLRAPLVVLGRRYGAPETPVQVFPPSDPMSETTPRRGRRARLLGTEPPSQPVELDEAEVARSATARGAPRALRASLPGRLHDDVVSRGAADDDRVDAVVIATPVSTHFELARRRCGPASTCSSRSRSRGS